MSRIAACLLALSLALPAFGQTPAPTPPNVPPPAQVVAKAVIVAPAYVYAGDPIVLLSKGSTGGNRKWQVVGSTATPDIADNDHLVLLSTAKGTYRFALYVTGPTTGSFDATTTEVSVIAPGDPVPPPIPDPNLPPVPADPVSTKLDGIGSKLDAGFSKLSTQIGSLVPVTPPAPTPVPVPVPPVPTPTPTIALPAFVTLVYDSSTIAKPIPARTSITLPASVAALNAHWITLDVQDTAEYQRRGLSSSVASVGTPCVIVQGSPATTGGGAPVVASAKLPADEPSTLAYIKSILGAK